MKRSTPEETRVALGQRLHHLRREKDISQAAGLHYTHVGRLERGVASPKAGALQRLAGALDVSVEYLLEGAEQQVVRVNIEDKDPLRQPDDPHRRAGELARAQGVSLNQFFLHAIADMVSEVET